MPPRHGKSEICSKHFPAWYNGGGAAKNLDDIFERSIIAASYNARLARGFGKVARNYARSNLFYDIFGTNLDRQSGTAAGEWALDNGNTYASAGVNGGITGLGASVLLIDDPIKDRKQADSPTWRENLKDWYKEVALTRLTPDGAVVIIMTRWHYDDLVGYLLREHEEENWDQLTFPAIQTEHDMDSRLYDKRKPGEPLWGNRFTIERVLELQEALGTSFGCLYQQDPQTEGGQVLNVNDFVEDFKLLSSPEEMMERYDFQRYVTSWDTAFEENRTSDYSVGSTYGDTGKAYYLVDVVRARMRFPTLKKKMKVVQEKWNSDAVLIEKKASGHDIYWELDDTTDLPLIAITPKGDKVARAAAVTGRMEAGRVHIPISAPWKRMFLTELKHFPKVDHDDQVDSYTQAIRWLTKDGGSYVDND